MDIDQIADAELEKLEDRFPGKSDYILDVMCMEKKSRRRKSRTPTKPSPSSRISVMRRRSSPVPIKAWAPSSVYHDMDEMIDMMGVMSPNSRRSPLLPSNRLDPFDTEVDLVCTETSKPNPIRSVTEGDDNEEDDNEEDDDNELDIDYFD
jgi:hypothetical protein